MYAVARSSRAAGRHVYQLTPPPPPQASISCAPEEIKVGEEVVCQVEVRHPKTMTVQVIPPILATPDKVKAAVPDPEED